MKDRLANARRIISIMQPGYFPWPGFFDLIYRSNIFVVYDSVKYTKATWRNRNRIRIDCPEGWKYITVPVEKIAENKPIRDVRIANDCWGRKHKNLVRAAYASAPHVQSTLASFDRAFSDKWTFLADLDNFILETFLDLFGGSDTKIVHASDLDLEAIGSKTQKLLEICQVLGADCLYDSAGAKAFFDHSVFTGTGIQVVFQDYAPPVYPQVYAPFIPGLSSLDLVANCGPDSLNTILGRNS